MECVVFWLLSLSIASAQLSYPPVKTVWPLGEEAPQSGFTHGLLARWGLKLLTDWLCVNILERLLIQPSYGVNNYFDSASLQPPNKWFFTNCFVARNSQGAFCNKCRLTYCKQQIDIHLLDPYLLQWITKIP